MPRTPNHVRDRLHWRERIEQGKAGALSGALAVLLATGCAAPVPEQWPRFPPGAGTRFPPVPAAHVQRAADLPEARTRELTISLATQYFSYLEDGSLVRSGPISSGEPSSPTPTGRFRVQSKQKDKVSSKYENELGEPAWMPYSIQFYGDYFIHEGWLPGHAASHGCVRMDREDAAFLFERMKIGDPVIIEG